ncbi:TMEM165 [Cordylochernes scorpioides]|uniref:GDT1 family protein n=1 Tax=Cordylochernes scorpioides TaxID=51811 RepID=A0ABY6L3Y4_9ARAC|nr:TMEM165 [Cordylochernes scorpioides]
MKPSHCCFLALALLVISTAAAQQDPPAAQVVPNTPEENAKEVDVDVYYKFKNYIERYITTKGFIAALLSSTSMIIVSELGDKTFFIAVIMASRHSRLVVFLGALSALAIMTIFSDTCGAALIGSVSKQIPQVYVYYISTALFAIFGIRMLKEAYQMSPEDGQEEYEEAHRTIIRRESELEKESMMEGDVETGFKQVSRLRLIRRRLRLIFSRVFLEAFTTTYLAEWGDRSQVTTIFLAAKENAFGVTIGATFGHCICTLLAVLGGRVIAQKISVRTVTFIGGIIFMIFAITALISGPDQSMTLAP